MLGARLAGLDEREHLDLVELVHAEDPARVLAGRARLAAKAGREARVAARDLARAEDLVHVQGGERDLRGPDQEQLVARDLVDHLALAGEEPGALERLLAHEHGRDDGLEALLGQQPERVADERHLDHHQVAHQVGEAGARGARRALDVDQPVLGAELDVVADLEVEARALADLAQRHGVLVGLAVGGAGLGQVGERQRELVAGALDLAELGLEALDLGRELAHLRRSPRRRRGPRAWPRRSPPRPCSAAPAPPSTSGSSSRRRSSSRSSSSSSSAAPRRASAALTAPGSSRMRLRSSEAGPAAPVDYAAVGGRRQRRRRLRAGVLVEEPRHRLGVVADDDVLGHDRAREAAVADREERVLVVRPGAGRSWGPGCAACCCRTPACRRPSSVWQPEQRSAKSTAPS